MTKVSIIIHIWDGEGERNRGHPNIVSLYAVGTTKGEEEDNNKKNPNRSKSKSLQNTRGDRSGGNGLVPRNLSFIQILRLKYTLCNHIYR